MTRPIPTLRRLAALAMALALAGGATACRPLVGVRATVSLDERTRLEQQVRGTRGQVDARSLLLSVQPGPADALRPEDLEGMLAEHVALEERLAAVPKQSAETRAWQVIARHNRAVIEARLGRRDRAEELMQGALARAVACGLPELEWQVLVELAEFQEGPARTAMLSDAAMKALACPVLTPLDHSLEDADRAARMYAALVAAALAEGDPEGALQWAAEREALVLSRTVPPGARFPASGEGAALAQELATARQAAARARDTWCRLPLEALSTDGPPDEFQAFDAALAAVEEVRDRIVGSSPVAGLLVADPADLMAVQELLPGDTLLALWEPTGGDTYAAFVLGQDAFAARQVTTADLLVPLAEHATDEIRRLYLVPPAGLSDLPWQRMTAGGRPLAERYEIAFLTGLSDLPWAFEQKGYGRQSVLWCGVEDPEGIAEGGAVVDYFDVSVRPKDELPGAAQYADILLFHNPLQLRPEAPAESYLSFPGPLPLLSGVSMAEFAAYDTRASCAAFFRVAGEPFAPGSHGALRVLARSLMAAGAHSYSSLGKRSR